MIRYCCGLDSIREVVPINYAMQDALHVIVSGKSFFRHHYPSVEAWREAANKDHLGSHFDCADMELRAAVATVSHHHPYVKEG